MVSTCRSIWVSFLPSCLFGLVCEEDYAKTRIGLVNRDEMSEWIKVSGCYLDVKLLTGASIFAVCCFSGKMCVFSCVFHHLNQIVENFGRKWSWNPVWSSIQMNCFTVRVKLMSLMIEMKCLHWKLKKPTKPPPKKRIAKIRSQLSACRCLSLCTGSAARPQQNTTSNRPFPLLISSFPDCSERARGAKKDAGKWLLAAEELSPGRTSENEPPAVCCQIWKSAFA